MKWGHATFNGDVIWDGVYVSLIGMTEVFGVLMLLGLSIFLLSRLDRFNWRLRYWRENNYTLETSDQLSKNQDSQLKIRSDASLAAAIGVSLAIAEITKPSQILAKTLEHRSGSSWVQTGRLRQLSGNKTNYKPGRLS